MEIPADSRRGQGRVSERQLLTPLHDSVVPILLAESRIADYKERKFACCCCRYVNLFVTM